MYKYAGQIFCEMLGQTCHKEFYQNYHMEYQEVFPLRSLYSLTLAELRHPRQSLLDHNLLRQTTQHLPFRNPKIRWQVP